MENLDKILSKLVKDGPVSNEKYQADNLKFVSSRPEKFQEAVIEYLNMRKLNKKQATNYALNLVLRDLVKMSTDIDTQIAILNQSIKNNWTDIYELKQQNNFKPQQQEQKVPAYLKGLR